MVHYFLRITIIFIAIYDLAIICSISYTFIYYHSNKYNINHEHL